MRDFILAVLLGLSVPAYAEDGITSDVVKAAREPAPEFDALAARINRARAATQALDAEVRYDPHEEVSHWSIGGPSIADEDTAMAHALDMKRRVDTLNSSPPSDVEHCQKLKADQKTNCLMTAGVSPNLR